ncbi:MAG: hypothetical protein ACLQDV_03045 [Candidatus Binataceae bacterium]
MRNHLLPIATGLVISCLTFLCSSRPIQAGQAFSDSTMSGEIDCYISTALWPASAGEPMLGFKRGFIRLVADGKGTLTEGNLHFEGDFFPQTAPPEHGSCIYDLSQGTYRLSADGSGKATMTFLLHEGGGQPVCTSIYSLKVPRKKIIEPDFILVSSASGEWKGYSTLMGPLGVAAIMCEPKR